MRMRSNLEKTILLKSMVCGEEMEGNLTKGPILKTLTKLAIPIMASSFLGTLYNLTDMAWIGLLGSKAVAGVGVGGMYTWLSQGLASMARMGGQVQADRSTVSYIDGISICGNCIAVFTSTDRLLSFG